MSTGKQRAEEREQLENFSRTMHRHMGVYNRTARPDEMDLLAHVRGMLVEQLTEGVVADLFDTDRHIRDAVGKNAHAQQFHLNQYFALQFMSAASQDIRESQLARYSLLTDARPDEWLMVFKQKILPTFLHFNLPVRLS